MSEWHDGYLAGAEFTIKIAKKSRAELEEQVAELREAAQAVVDELQDCWENTPNKLEFTIGELAKALEADDE